MSVGIEFHSANVAFVMSDSRDFNLMMEAEMQKASSRIIALFY